MRPADSVRFSALFSAVAFDYDGAPARLCWFYDVSKLKQAEQNAMDSEAAARQLREAVETFSDSIILFDKSERVVFTNDQYHTLFPKFPPKNEIIGCTHEHLLRLTLEAGRVDDPSAKSDPEAWLAQTLEDRRSGHAMDGERTHTDGRTMLFRYSSASDGGQIIAYTDVTERKQQEEALRRSEAEFRSVFETNAAGMALLDMQGRYCKVNKRFCEIVGYDEHELLERTWRDITLTEDVARVEDLDRQIAEGGQANFIMERRLIHKNGSTIWTSLDSSQLSDENGDPHKIFSFVQDITELKEAEKRLQDSERALRDRQLFLETVLDHMPVHTSIRDLDGRFLAVNAQYEALFGLKRDQLIGKHYDEVLPPEYAAVAKERDKLVLESRKPIKTERSMLSEEGEQTFISTIFPIFDSSEQMIAIGGANFDITDRKRADERLRSREAYLTEILDSSPIAVSIANADGIFKYANVQAQELAMRDLEDIKRTHASDVYADPEERKAITRALQQDGEVKNQEIQFLRPDGSIRWALASMKTAHQDDETEHIAWFVDINERKRDENRFRALLESAPDSMVIVNAEGMIKQINRQTESLFGYKSVELIGREVERLIPKSYRAQHPAHLRDYFTNASVRPMGSGLELFGVKKDGIEFPIEISLSPIDTEEGMLVSAAIRDISDRRERERALQVAKVQAETALNELHRTQGQLVQSEKLASLGQLTAGIAHEIKNPLNFVNNFSETSVELLAELSEVLTPLQSKMDADTKDDIVDLIEPLSGDLEKIHHHGTRADGIVKSMLQHARGGDMDWADTDVNGLVDEALNLAYHGERARDKSFLCETSSDFDDAAGTALVVPQEITRVLVNLFTNAFYAVKQRAKDAKAAGEDYAARVEATTKDLGDRIEFGVRDNGTGMSDSVKAKLFDPFFTTKPANEGTGLGLSLSFDVVTQQNGGHISVDSEPGSYTEFVIELPRKAAGAGSV